MKTKSLLFALLLVALAACKPSPAQQALEMVQDTIRQVEKANDMAELNDIQAAFQKKFESIDAPEGYEPTQEEEAALQDALQAYLQAYVMKISALSSETSNSSRSSSCSD